MEYGYVRVAAASPQLRVADCEFNTKKIIEAIKEAQTKSVEFLVFPELCITGCTCGDLFREYTLLNGARISLLKIADKTKESPMIIVVGLPLSIKGRLYNCAAVVQKGRILGIVPKSNLLGDNQLYEQRWFTQGEYLNTDEIMFGDTKVPVGGDQIFIARDNESTAFGIEIGEDLGAMIPPSSYLVQHGAVLIFNLSACFEIIGKANYIRELVTSQSARGIAGYVYASSNCGESSTDFIYGGHMMIAENGHMLSESDKFYFESKMIMTDIDLQRLKYNRLNIGAFHEGKKERRYRNVYFDGLPDTKSQKKLLRHIDKQPFVPVSADLRDERCHEILSIQTSGLEKRLRHTGLQKLVVGISGGLDSTLAFIVAIRTMERLNLPKSNVVAITMPGFGTTGRTYDNSLSLIKGLGACLKVIDIKEACLQHFKDIGHDRNCFDVTYENVQARERTQILMDLANKSGGLVVGTGDLSELALGWCTYNGDHMSMYGVNSGVPKTLIRHIIQWYAENEADENIKTILYDIIDTPISPELMPLSGTGEMLQKTEEILGPYEVHDFFLYNILRGGASPKKALFMAKIAFSSYTEVQLKRWLVVFYKRFFSQQFKRSCLPDGPKVGTVSLSPRGDWMMPSDASVNLWLRELENM